MRLFFCFKIFPLPDEEEFGCSHCGYIIAPEDEIEVVDEREFKCPEYREKVEI